MTDTVEKLRLLRDLMHRGMLEPLDHLEFEPALATAANELERLRAAAAKFGAENEPVAYLHTLHMERGQTSRRITESEDNPFGKPGRDYSPEYEVFTEPLYRGAID